MRRILKFKLLCFLIFVSIFTVFSHMAITTSGILERFNNSISITTLDYNQYLFNDISIIPPFEYSDEIKEKQYFSKIELDDFLSKIKHPSPEVIMIVAIAKSDIDLAIQIEEITDIVAQAKSQVKNQLLLEAKMLANDYLDSYLASIENPSLEVQNIILEAKSLINLESQIMNLEDIVGLTIDNIKTQLLNEAKTAGKEYLTSFLATINNPSLFVNNIILDAKDNIDLTLDIEAINYIVISTEIGVEQQLLKEEKMNANSNLDAYLETINNPSQTALNILSNAKNEIEATESILLISIIFNQAILDFDVQLAKDNLEFSLKKDLPEYLIAEIDEFISNALLRIDENNYNNIDVFNDIKNETLMKISQYLLIKSLDNQNRNTDKTIIISISASMFILVILFLTIFFFRRKDQMTPRLNRIEELILNGIQITDGDKQIIQFSNYFWQLTQVIENNDLKDEDRIKNKREIERTYRYLKSLNIELNDYSGRKFNNLNLDVLTQEPNPTLKEPIVFKTIHPEIRVKGIIVQKSKVIIQVPSNENNNTINNQNKEGNYEK
jgi:hypothetical protein